MRKRFIWYMFVCIFIVFMNQSLMNIWTLFIFNMCGLSFMDYIVFEKLTIKRGVKDE